MRRLPVIEHRGFTLIELIIVIAILVGLAGIVFLSLDPQRRLEQTRQSQMDQNAEQLTKAVNLQIVDQFALPLGLNDGASRDICKEGVPDGTGGCFSLDLLKEEGYIASIPSTLEYQDNPSITGYEIIRDGGYVAICPKGGCLASATGQTTSDSGSDGSDSSPGAALGFPAGGAAVTFPYAPSLQFDEAGEPFSISFWLKPDDVVANKNLLTGPSYSLYMVNTQTIGVAIMTRHPSIPLTMWISGNVAALPVGSPSAYHHVLLTYDGNGGFGPPNYSAKLYIDGNNSGLTTDVDTATQDVGPYSDPLNIAGGPAALGLMDDVRIYSRNLSQTPADIGLLADQISSNDPADGLVHHWDFNENDGTTVNDLVPSNAVDGQFVGSPPPQWSSDVPF